MTPQPPQRPDAAETAALYASGALTADGLRAFERELEQGDGALRDEVQALDAVARGLAELIEPVEPAPTTRDAVLAATETHDDSHQVWRDWETDGADDKVLFTLPADSGSWESTGIDGVEVRRLFVDREANRMTAMFRMAPGTEYVPHIHDGAEECYVLQGDLHVGDDIVMHAGDYQRAPAGSLHGVQRTVNGCVLLISSSLTDKVA